mgnify:CR=1 FL=1
MPNRENVIKGLQNLRDAIATDFIHEADQAVETIDDAIVLLKEQKGMMLALEQSNAVNGYLNAEVERLNGLLKEQEAVEPICQIIFDVPYYLCGSCKTMLNMYAVKAKYCSQCGRPVRWE